MLLIDGAKYQEWTPTNEEEFERIVAEHASDIFGENSKYFDLKHKLVSRSGAGSIPDGYVITFGDQPQMHIVELELASHTLQHIVPQIVNIISGIENPATQQKICNKIEDEINQDEILSIKITKAIKPIAIHRFLSDYFSTRLPMINIIIDKNSPLLEEALNKITHPHRIIEFRTFRRVGAEAVHAHLFEPIYIVLPPSPPPPPSPEGSVEIDLEKSYIKYRYIQIPKVRRDLFPTSNTMLELDTDIGHIETQFSVDPSWGLWLHKGLAKWFKAHPELKVGGKIAITVLEPMKKYRLEILKE